MKNTVLCVVICGVLFGCAGAGGLKPSVGTFPTSYLKEFPLNTITETEMIMKSGPPASNIKVGGKDAMVYKLGEGMGERTYTYIVENGVIIDVLYNDHGFYNGITAKQEQGK